MEFRCTVHQEYNLESDVLNKNMERMEGEHEITLKNDQELVIHSVE